MSDESQTSPRRSPIPAPWTMLVMALFGSAAPSGMVYTLGSRPNSENEKRIERLEKSLEAISAEQLERSNRLARLEANDSQTSIRLGRIEDKLDRVLGGK